MNIKVTEGVAMSYNYIDPFWAGLGHIKTGVVVQNEIDWSIWRWSFHPYDGSRPVPCAKPYGYRTHQMAV